jgi:hypothetical protein
MTIGSEELDSLGLVMAKRRRRVYPDRGEGRTRIAQEAESQANSLIQQKNAIRYRRRRKTESLSSHNS